MHLSIVRVFGTGLAATVVLAVHVLMCLALYLCWSLSGVTRWYTHVFAAFLSQPRL